MRLIKIISESEEDRTEESKRIREKIKEYSLKEGERYLEGYADATLYYRRLEEKEKR